MELQREDIARIVEEVLKNYSCESISGKSDLQKSDLPVSDSGVFECMEEAIKAASSAQKIFIKMPISKRAEIIESMRLNARKNIKLFSELAVSETGMGIVEDKIAKHEICIAKTPGPEILKSTAYTGDNGLTLVEMGPYGVIGSITPSTNPSTTVINNSISMLSAGNSVVFNPHPQAKRVSQKAVQVLNEAVVAAGGPANLMTTVDSPTFASGQILMKSPEIRLLAVTGGPEIVRLSMMSGKKVIAAGPGNPPVVVDETADIRKAAEDIVFGASFDNNIMCIAEKEIFAVDAIFGELKEQMIMNGCYELSYMQAEDLTRIVFKAPAAGSHEPVLDRKYVGKPAYFIARAIGLDIPMNTKLLIADVDASHPLVSTEQLMPVIPLVKVRNAEEGIDLAYRSENNYFHTASMFSRNVDNLTKMALKINTTIFVKNAPTLAGLGYRGEGFTTLTIATPTGEGITCASTFTRQRRCTLSESMRII